MNKSWELAQSDTQGQLFEASAREGYGSKGFIKAFMTGTVAADMDKEYHHLQGERRQQNRNSYEDLTDLRITENQIEDDYNNHTETKTISLIVCALLPCMSTIVQNPVMLA